MKSRLNDDDTNLVPTIERIRMGDSDAFQWIYNHYIASVRRRCRKRLCREDQCLQIEDDIANEIMASLWISLCSTKKHLSTLSQLNAIVHRMVVERCIDRARYIHRRKRSLSSNLSALFDTMYACRIPWYDMRELETLSLIRELIDSLSCHELKNWVSLRWKGYSNAEIARKWGTSTRTVERKMQAVGDCFRTKWPQVG
jgi:DNA-directed RNA polymerase specialized sigma24 family protein